MLALDVRELVRELGAGSLGEEEMEEEAAGLRKAVLSFNTPVRARPLPDLNLRGHVFDP